MNMDSLIGRLITLLFALMLLPFFVLLGLQVICTLFQILLSFLLALLPWLILIAFAVGAGAALTMRRRLPRRNGNYFPPGGAQPIHRPRDPRRDSN